MEHKRISIFDLLASGVKAFIDNILLFLSVPFVGIGLMGIVTIIFSAIGYYLTPGQFEMIKVAAMTPHAMSVEIFKQIPTSTMILGFGYVLTMLYIMYGILYGLIKIILAIYSNREPSIFMLTGYFSRSWALLITYIIYYSFILFGLILFIIPGIYLAARFLLAPYILVDQNCSIIEAFKKSANLTRGNFLIVFSVIIVTFFLVSIPVFNIAGFFISGMMYVGLYRKLTTH